MYVYTYFMNPDIVFIKMDDLIMNQLKLKDYHWQ